MFVSWLFLLAFAFSVFVIAINTAGYALLPDKYPLNWYELAGWVLFIIVIILWEIGKK